jgi:hypothetical protein
MLKYISNQKKTVIFKLYVIHISFCTINSFFLMNVVNYTVLKGMYLGH